MRNDLATVLLALFVPWETLPSLFNDMSICGDDCNTNCDKSRHTGLQACSIVWSKIRASLPEHVQDFVRNVEILRKSKEDADVDMIERKAAASAMQIAFNPDGDDGDEILDEASDINGSVDDDTLRTSYYLIKRRWAKEDRSITAGFAALQQPWRDLPTISAESFTPIHIFDPTSGIRQDISSTT
jgi:hypothetical protein